MAQYINSLASMQTDLAEQNKGNALFLVLGRKGVVDIELRNPLTNEVVYCIRDTGRGSLSRKPDFEVYRPAAGDLFVGSIRFGITTTETHLLLTGSKSKGVDKVKIRHIPGQTNDYVWKTIHCKRKSVKDRWIETNDDGKSELYTNEEVIILELVEERNQEQDPICVVRLYNTQPTGRFEIWAKNAWVNQGGDWHALDELVVSAYARMEAAKRSLMGGIDPTSFRFAGV